MNTCATVTVGTWVERLNACKTEFASMFRGLFGTESVKNVNNQNAKKTNYSNSTPHCDSAIVNYLLHKPKCASQCNDNQFFILSKARSNFHLSVLESIFITL